MSEYVRLGDVFSVIRNGANIKQLSTNSGYPITRIETISDRTINRDKMGYADITDISKYKDYVLQDGDILMSHINSEKHLGKAAIYKKENDEIIIHGMNLLMLRANKKLLLPHYAKYFFESNIFLSQIATITKKSVNQASFTVSALKELDILCPDLYMQNDIVAKLDKVTVLIDKYKKQLQKLDELVKARFVEMFGDVILNPKGWNKSKLGDVCDVRDGTHDSPEYHDIGYPLVTSKNVTGGKIDLTDCSLICESDYLKICERSKVDYGDIIMPMIGTVGKPVIVDIEPRFAIKNVALIKFKHGSKVLNIYIKTLLASDYFDNAVLSKIRGGTQKFISLGDIRKLEILLPSMDVQKAFSAFMEQTDKLESEIKHSLEKLETLNKALMQKYFG